MSPHITNGMSPLMPQVGTPELLLVLVVLVLLFGARKLPELARGYGRALRIFKIETGMLTSEDEPAKHAPAHPDRILDEARTRDVTSNQ